MKLPELIKDLSNKGCTDAEAIEIATDLIKVDMLKSEFGHLLDEVKLSEVIEATKKTSDQDRKLAIILHNLSERERECYLMHTVQLMSMGKIAESLAVSKSSVQTYIDRARDKVVKLIEETTGGSVND